MADVEQGSGWIRYGGECGITWSVDADALEMREGCGSACAGTLPRQQVLRLLAAEASDRLGWVWEVNADMEEPSAHTTDYWRGPWIFAAGAFRWHGNDAGDGFDADTLLAAHHGRFLLEDAIREAGR